MTRMLRKIKRELKRKTPARLKILEKDKARLEKMLNSIPDTKETSTNRLWIEIKLSRTKRAIINLKRTTIK